MQKFHVHGSDQIRSYGSNTCIVQTGNGEEPNSLNRWMRKNSNFGLILFARSENENVSVSELLVGVVHSTCRVGLSRLPGSSRYKMIIRANSHGFTVA